MSSIIVASAGFYVSYIVLLIVALVASFILGARLRPQGRQHKIDDPHVVAWLTGGAERYVDTIITGLLARDALVVSGKNKLQVNRGATGATGAERKLLAKSGPFGIGQARRLLADDARLLVKRLTEQGLLATAHEQTRLRILQAAPLLALGGTGVMLALLSRSEGGPPDGLIVLVGITLLFALGRIGSIDARTRGGKEAADKALRSHGRLYRAPVQDEMALAVALFGTAVLGGSALDAFYQMRKPSDSGGSDSSGSSDNSGGGCGGGCGGGD